VRSVHPTPEGLALSVRTGALLVALRFPPPIEGELPSVGTLLRFDVEEKNVRPMG
jgi:hypothetical protein